MKSVLVDLAGIAASGTLGAIAGWLAMRALGGPSLPAALAAVAVGMVVATALFLGYVTLLRRLRWRG